MKTRDTHRAEQRHDTIKSHLVAEHRHDPYEPRGKLAEPSVCPQCSAVYESGRWQWRDTVPADAREHLCAACRRIREKLPAGEVVLSGAFAVAHADEIVNLVRNIEKREQHEHPLQRIMDLDRSDDRIVVTTTDIHLPRKIAHAVEAAYKGELETHYDEAAYFARFNWRRAT
jgi:hypothetical protein